MHLQWAWGLVVGVLAGRGEARCSLAWCPSRTQLHCHLGVGVEPQGKVCVSGWFCTTPTLYAASVKQDLLDQVKCFSVRQLLCPVPQRAGAEIMHVLLSL